MDNLTTYHLQKSFRTPRLESIYKWIKVADLLYHYHYYTITISKVTESDKLLKNMQNLKLQCGENNRLDEKCLC